MYDDPRRAATVVIWAAILIGWFGLATYDATEAFAVFPTGLVVGIAVVAVCVGTVVAAATEKQTRLVAGCLFVAGGTAVVLSVTDIGAMVLLETLSLVGDLAVFAGLVLVISLRLGEGAKEMTA